MTTNGQNSEYNFFFVLFLTLVYFKLHNTKSSDLIKFSPVFFTLKIDLIPSFIDFKDLKSFFSTRFNFFNKMWKIILKS